MALKNDQYNKIFREYDNLRLQSKHDLNARREEVFNALPDYKLLEDELITIAAKSGRMAILGDDNILKKLKQTTKYIEKKQKDILISTGYPPNYLSLQFNCNKCGDTGFIDNEKCNCFKQAIADLMYTGSNLKSILSDENFSNFSFDYYSDDYHDDTINATPRNNIQKIVASSKSFIRNFKTNHDNILLLGNTGVGKTFLANCIAKELLDRGFTVIYLTAFRLFDILEKYKFNRNGDNSHSIADQFNYILDCDLLIIDDLGTELNNTFTTSQLYLIINERLLRQKSTIISTNLSLDNLNTNYSERIYSRLISSYTIRRIVGEDIRLDKALNESLPS